MRYAGSPGGRQAAPEVQGSVSCCCGETAGIRRSSEPARQHPLFTGLRTAAAEQSYHRAQMVDAARLLPEEWIRSTAGIGTPSEIVALLNRYFDAGLDEVILHGSSPAQNRPVLDAWRKAKS